MENGGNKIKLVNTREIILSALVSPLLCLESALVEHTLTTYIDKQVTVSYTGSTILSNQFLELIPNEFGEKDVIEINGRRVTSPERTICEMLLFDRRDDLIIEAIDDYLNGMGIGTKGTLLIKAEEYGVLEVMGKFIDEVEDYFEY